MLDYATPRPAGEHSGSDSQTKRRRFFVGVLAVIFLPAFLVALFPDAQAEETDVSSSELAVVTVTEPTTTTAAPTTTTTAAPTTTTTVAPTTTAAPKPKATTTTTAAPKATTATAAPSTTAAPAPAPPAPAPVATGGGASPAEAAFLACIRQRESGGNYGVVSANGLYFGAYQFMRSSWDSTANHAGRPDLVGVAPNVAAPGDQDAMALHLFRWQGKRPWNGAC
jgi:hypothetical protein